MRLMAWHLMLSSIKLGGAAFIKWGQWSATREDMFPKVGCCLAGVLQVQVAGGLGCGAVSWPCLQTGRLGDSAAAEKGGSLGPATSKAC